MADWSLPRADLSRRDREDFRPPPLARAGNAARRPALSARRSTLALRRFADLQFGSIWRDLAALLPQVVGTLADVGCGAQPFRALIPPHVRYIGVDIEESESRFGYGGAPGDASDTRRYHGTVLPLADAEADAVLCTETLEHILDTAAFLAELQRVLKPRGRLILTVPFAARWHFVPFDYWRYTPSGLAHVLEAAGFGEVRIYARGGALAVACYKTLGYVLLLLVGHGRRGLRAVPARLLGLCLAPLALLSAALGNVGMRGSGAAEDTLGYTVLAERGGGPPRRRGGP